MYPLTLPLAAVHLLPYILKLCRVSDIETHWKKVLEKKKTGENVVSVARRGHFGILVYLRRDCLNNIITKM